MRLITVGTKIISFYGVGVPCVKRTHSGHGTASAYFAMVIVEYDTDGGRTGGSGDGSGGGGDAGSVTHTYHGAERPRLGRGGRPRTASHRTYQHTLVEGQGAGRGEGCEGAHGWGRAPHPTVASQHLHSPSSAVGQVEVGRAGREGRTLWVRDVTAQGLGAVGVGDGGAGARVPGMAPCCRLVLRLKGGCDVWGLVSSGLELERLRRAAKPPTGQGHCTDQA
jgi:hypothetical protein